MEPTEEYFTLETLGKLYTDAAKAGGLEVAGLRKWSTASLGPNLSSKVSEWRPKQVPVVRYAIKYPNGVISVPSFKFKSDAEAWQTDTQGQVIKLIEVIEEV